jgi:hypothetical protein
MSINRRRSYRRPAVNYIPDRGGYEETYEQMLAKSCKWCSIKMVYRKDIDNLFCCYCGWQPPKPEPEEETGIAKGKS